MEMCVREGAEKKEERELRRLSRYPTNLATDRLKVSHSEQDNLVTLSSDTQLSEFDDLSSIHTVVGSPYLVISFHFVCVFCSPIDELARELQKNESKERKNNSLPPSTPISTPNPTPTPTPSTLSSAPTPSFSHKSLLSHAPLHWKFGRRSKVKEEKEEGERREKEKEKEKEREEGEWRWDDDSEASTPREKKERGERGEREVVTYYVTVTNLGAKRDRSQQTISPFPSPSSASMSFSLPSTLHFSLSSPELSVFHFQLIQRKKDKSVTLGEAMLPFRSIGVGVRPLPLSSPLSSLSSSLLLSIHLAKQDV